jgi:DNA polymerase alpha subunit A
MPQVQVALREIAKGKNPRVNDVMSYIVTGDSKMTSEPAAKRAYTPQDVLRADSGLRPDIEWYLYKQIFPPIERLCAPIDGTDAVRLAECLGLDTRKYSIASSASSTTQQQDDIFPLESQIPDAIRFQDAARLTLRCRSCQTSFLFEGLVASADRCSPTGIVCPTPSCAKPLTTLSVVAQLERALRAQTSAYYAAWLACDDPACGNRTRQMSVYGHRCLGPRGLATGCLGRMAYEYGEKRLYFASLWDVERAKREVRGGGKGGVPEGKEGRERRERVEALAEWNRERFGTMAGVVDAYLRKCGRRAVAMDGLFAFMLNR